MASAAGTRINAPHGMPALERPSFDRGSSPCAASGSARARRNPGDPVAGAQISCGVSPSPVERQQAAEALADHKVEGGSIQVRASIAESKAMPLRYAAELIGVGADSEKVIRWLIDLMVLCCDPLAIALIATASARRSITV